MRKHHKRWIALAGATTTSLAGFGVLGGATAAAADTPQPAPQVVEGRDTHYALGGFEITYLPPGLERYGIRAKMSTGTRDRVAFISWIQGGDEVHGQVSVIRSDSLKTIDDLRRSRYRHLDDDALEKIDNDGREAYLSEETGELFWVEEPGAAVAVYLHPDRWKREELTKFAAAVQKQESDVPASVQNALLDMIGLREQQHQAADRPEQAQAPEQDEQEPDAEPGTGASDDAAAENAGGEGAEGDDTPVSKPGMPLPDEQEESAPALPPGITAERVTTCLTRDLLDARDVDVARIDKVDRATFAKVWRGASGAERARSVTDCAEKLNAERSAPGPDSLDELVAAIWAIVDETFADLNALEDEESDEFETTEFTTTEVTTFDKSGPRNLEVSTASGFPWIVPKVTIGGKK